MRKLLIAILGLLLRRSVRNAGLQIVNYDGLEENVGLFKAETIPYLLLGTADGFTVLLVHGNPDGSVSADPSVHEHDALIACFPNRVREVHPNENVLGNWDGSTIATFGYEDEGRERVWLTLRPK